MSSFLWSVDAARTQDAGPQHASAFKPNVETTKCINFGGHVIAVISIIKHEFVLSPQAAVKKIFSLMVMYVKVPN